MIDAVPARKLIDTPSGVPISRAEATCSINPETTDYEVRECLNRYEWVYWDGWPKTFDYVVNVRFDDSTNSASDHLGFIGSGCFLDLYRVDLDGVP